LRFVGALMPRGTLFQGGPTLRWIVVFRNERYANFAYAKLAYLLFANARSSVRLAPPGVRAAARL